MKTLITLLLLTFTVLAFSQKPDLVTEKTYRFKEVPKISLKNLQIPSDSMGKYNFDIHVSEKATPNKKRRGLSSSGNLVRKRLLSVSGACTRQDGGIVTVNDPDYDSCLDGSVYVKKVILTDPTQSILMNLNLDGINFNPFE